MQQMIIHMRKLEYQVKLHCRHSHLTYPVRQFHYMCELLRSLLFKPFLQSSVMYGIIHKRRSVMHLHLHVVILAIINMMIHSPRLRVPLLHKPNDLFNFCFILQSKIIC